MNSVKRFAIKSAMKIAKHSPVILTVAGTVGLVATTALAVRAGRRIDDALDEAQHTVAEALEGHVTAIDETTIEVGEAVDGWDRVVLVTRAYAPVVKLVAPVVLTGAATAASFWFGHKILKDRYVQAVAAYEGMVALLRNYRARVAEEVGEDRERKLHAEAAVRTSKELADRTANRKHDDTTPSIHSVLFDYNNRNFNECDPELNLFFLRQVQTHLTNELQAKGHLFLNDAYKALGFPETPAGQLVGWISEKGKELPFVDLGLYDGLLQSHSPEDGVFIDFNIHGPIWERI